MPIHACVNLNVRRHSGSTGRNISQNRDVAAQSQRILHLHMFVRCLARQSSSPREEYAPKQASSQQ